MAITTAPQNSLNKMILYYMHFKFVSV